MKMRIVREKTEEVRKGIFGGKTLKCKYTLLVIIELNEKEEALFEKYGGFKEEIKIESESPPKNIKAVSDGERYYIFPVSELLKGVSWEEVDRISENLARIPDEIRAQLERLRSIYEAREEWSGTDLIEW